ncbi:MAG: twin-arginine translocase TatA/TatE family subunit [Planctomycetaceae bacterium]|jgi:sec-independent protein translocase protein TatA|nr:twin-arginine translocase TatA/TatE family subunit [Planctomycetaceae bacterium]
MFGGIGTTEMVAFGVLALMLFGSKLPEVARNLGGTYRGLKRNVDDFKREFQAVETYEPPKHHAKVQSDEPQIVESSAPKFEIPKDEDS